MLEFIYKLNLPTLDQILTDQGKSEFLSKRNKVFYKQYKPAGLIKPEWLTWQGFEWDLIVFFYKDNFKGVIHSDGSNTWGINWIYNGWGTMEYWSVEDISMGPVAPDDIGSPRSVCTSNNGPCKVYTTNPGVYLTNACQPHLATGYDGRYALSLRCTTKAMPWQKTVDIFRDLII
jgi:hypothetical protein